MLDHELQAAVVRGEIGHGERAVLVGAGDPDVDVLAAVERHLAVLDAQHEPADVAGERLDRLDARAHGAQRDPAAQDLLVVVDELDLEVRHGMGLAQQGPALVELELRQREGRVAVEVDLAVQQEGLARRALPLLAAVHQHQALAEGAVEDRLVLVDLEVDPDRLEPDRVLLAHGGSAQTRAGRPPGPPAL